MPTPMRRLDRGTSERPVVMRVLSSSAMRSHSWGWKNTVACSVAMGGLFGSRSSSSQLNLGGLSEGRGVEEHGGLHWGNGRHRVRQCQVGWVRAVGWLFGGGTEGSLVAAAE